MHDVVGCSTVPDEWLHHKDAIEWNLLISLRVALDNLESCLNGQVARPQ